jgi:hypothetical protein
MELEGGVTRMWGEWCGLPGQQGLRGSKMGRKINTFNKKNLIHDTKTTKCI